MAETTKATVKENYALWCYPRYEEGPGIIMMRFFALNSEMAGIMARMFIRTIKVRDSRYHSNMFKLRKI